jgi:hypothetical protein
MCELANGPAPSRSHHAAHECGNGHLACVNPRHLSWKTPRENQLDSIRMGTNGKKLGMPQRKLTAEKVSEIKALAGKMTHYELAAIYGVKARVIGKVIAGKLWNTDRKVFTPDEVRAIRALQGKMSRRAIAEKFGAKEMAIYNIHIGKNYRHIK